MSYQDQMALLQEKRRELRALEAQAERTAKSMQPLTLDDELKMVQMQARADDLYRGAGRLPAPLAEPHERPQAYERRLVDGLRVYSKRWERADLTKLPDDVFAIAREQVYADAAVNARTHGIRANELKPISTRTASGHESVEYVGGSEAWFGKQFYRPARRAVFADQATYSAMASDANLARVAEVVRTMRPPLQAPRAGF
jgi:hypothetical protein